MTAVQNYRVDSFVAGLAIKAPVKVASSGPLTLSGEQTVTGRVLVSGDRVLVKDQADPIENGIYNVETSAWQRAGDFDGSRDVVTGTVVPAYRVSDGEFVYYMVDGVGANVLIPGEDAINFVSFYDPATVGGATPTLDEVLTAGNSTGQIFSTGSHFITAADGGTLLADYTDGTDYISIGPGTGINKRITSEGGSLEIIADAGLAQVVVFGGSNFEVIQGGSIYNQEKAAANLDLVGYGQFWVRNDTPCTPMFTDDTGVDYVLNGAATLTPPVVLGDDEQIQFGDATDVTVEWDSGTNALQIAAAVVNQPIDIRDSQILRIRNPADTGYIEIQNVGFLTLNSLEIRKGAGSTSSIDYTVGAWDHNDNRFLRPVLDDYAIQDQVDGSAAGLVNIGFEQGNSHFLELTENITSFLLTNPPVAGRLGQLELEILQDSVVRTIAWPANIDWDGGVAPNLSTANGTYLIHFRTRDGGTSYLGVWAGPFS